MNNKLKEKLFSAEGVVNFKPYDYIEVQPNIFSPLLVNIKRPLENFELRNKIITELIRKINKNSICVCGIESGGSYYASAIADLLRKPLVLFRKKKKKYGIHGRLVGNLPLKPGLITIVDDVLAGGTISTQAVKYFKNERCDVELIIVFSYQPILNETLSKIKITSLTNLSDLLKFGQKNKFFKKKDVKLIQKEVDKFRK